MRMSHHMERQIGYTTVSCVGIPGRVRDPRDEDIRAPVFAVAHETRCHHVIVDTGSQACQMPLPACAPVNWPMIGVRRGHKSGVFWSWRTEVKPCGPRPSKCVRTSLTKSEGPSTVWRRRASQVEHNAR